MTPSAWGFYGRKAEETQLQQIVARNRWFFCEISGRRRIGKTTLISRLVERLNSKKRAFYLQIPDSDTAGVLQAAHEALEDFDIPESEQSRPRNLQELARMVGKMTESGYFVVLDEFQYFHRKQIAPFCSYLQAEVDRLLGLSSASGGLFVLGSIHNEMMAILEDKDSPLYNRVTDRIPINHLDFETLRELWETHGIVDPYQQLFLWSLFEGIPKFYRDCFEQSVLNPSPDYRTRTLEGIFFRGSSPLRNEADNWFLSEFRGRYEPLLRIISSNAGCSPAQILEQIRTVKAAAEGEQITQYLDVLVKRFQIIERRQPVFGNSGGKKNRYYVTDNFIASWLGAIDRQIRSSRVRPLDECVRACSQRLETLEGFALEKLIRLLSEELSRKGDPEFDLTDQVTGYWNRPQDQTKQIELDHISYNDEKKWVRFGSCKRSVSSALSDVHNFKRHVSAFLTTKEGRRFNEHTKRLTVFAPEISEEEAKRLKDHDLEAFSLRGLLQRL